jgi:hypothetical protein
MPPPKPRCWLSVRSGLKWSGSTKRAGSRLPEANRRTTVAPFGIVTPAILISVRVVRMRKCTGGSKRSTSSIVRMTLLGSRRNRPPCGKEALSIALTAVQIDDYLHVKPLPSSLEIGLLYAGFVIVIILRRQQFIFNKRTVYV